MSENQQNKNISREELVELRQQELLAAYEVLKVCHQERQHHLDILHLERERKVAPAVQAEKDAKTDLIEAGGIFSQARVVVDRREVEIDLVRSSLRDLENRSSRMHHELTADPAETFPEGSLCDVEETVLLLAVHFRENERQLEQARKGLDLLNGQLKEDVVALGEARRARDLANKARWQTNQTLNAMNKLELELQATWEEWSAKARAAGETVITASRAYADAVAGVIVEPDVIAEEDPAVVPLIRGSFELPPESGMTGAMARVQLIDRIDPNSPNMIVECEMTVNAHGENLFVLNGVVPPVDGKYVVSVIARVDLTMGMQIFWDAPQPNDYIAWMPVAFDAGLPTVRLTLEPRK